MYAHRPLMQSLGRCGRSFGTAIVVAILIVGTAVAKPMTEKEKIDALIQAVETRNDLQFIRLGEAHSGGDAARVLRIKLFYAGSRVNTVDEFIGYIASATVSGSPYFVRFPDGKQIPSAEFLRAELKRITQASAAPEK